ncbi:hypothetical protein [Actinomyces urinae]|nr:hypothetical protein [Actinomyces urinae]
MRLKKRTDDQDYLKRAQQSNEFARFIACRRVAFTTGAARVSS